MSWNEKLTEEQKNAASHFGGHACLLAGPGTGKTLALTRHICYLVEEQNIVPSKILAITFTRAAAHELRQRVQAELGVDKMPIISTLHSFALRQLLRNLRIITTLPQPLRIADDWEERHIILEDLKNLLSLRRIDDASELFNQLSADWQTLNADESSWNERFPNPAFLGAWREHRERYGYTLRSELVYQLKRALEQSSDFSLEGPPRYLIVDEYQDLNRCDLAIIGAIKNRGADVFIAGDDDQSIYGFRKAHPAGIRRFQDDFVGAQKIDLSLCKRCDPKILDLGLFVARQDYQRLEKPIYPEEGRSQGEVAILRFPDQFAEAKGIAFMCQHLIQRHGLTPHDILILMRSDRNNAFSSEIRTQLEQIGVPVTAPSEDSFLSDPYGRQVLALMRLTANSEDHLAWRTMLQVRNNQIGGATIDKLYRLSNTNETRFAGTVHLVADNPTLVDHTRGMKLQSEVLWIGTLINEFKTKFEAVNGNPDFFKSVLSSLIEKVVPEVDSRERISQKLQVLLETSDMASVPSLLRTLEALNVDIEQEVEKGKINILTMHKAKGLTAEATIVMAAEDEYIPGWAIGDEIGDERRLLYVSLTRAKHYLFITYCDKRTGRQRHTGNSSGKSKRTLTRFLRDAPVGPLPDREYFRRLV